MLGIMELAAAAALVMANGAVAQSTCYSDDLQCRITQLEARVAELEQRATRRASRGVQMALNRACGVYGCEEVARNACLNAGFARGVPIEIDPDGGFGGQVTRVECFD